MTQSLPKVNVGIDTSKHKLDVHLLERNLSLSAPNNEPAIAARATLTSGV